ncbi:MAG: Lrp/AsnC family transcriptional regulator [Pseudomonadota bacterium]|jgi:Lrp/AsnC family transcriptional regulator
MENIVLDSVDLKILRLVQGDAGLSIAELAERVGLSQTPCWKRLKRLEAEGVIRGRAVLLDQDKLGLSLTVFVTVRTNRHDAEWLEAFGAGVAALPQVVEFFRLAGEADYLLKVIVKDIAAYDAFYKTLIQVAPLADVSSSFAMERIKWTPALPI